MSPFVFDCQCLVFILTIWCTACTSAPSYQCNGIGMLYSGGNAQLGYGIDSSIVYLFGSDRSIDRWNVTSTSPIQLPIQTPSEQFISYSNNMVQISNMMYFVGMRGAPSLYIFDAITEDWHNRPELSQPNTLLSGGCLTGNDTHLFFIGGIPNTTHPIASSSTVWSHHLQIYDVSANTWIEEPISAYESAGGWSDGYCQAIHGNLFVFGGRSPGWDDHFHSTVLKRHSTTQWSTIATMDLQYHHTGAAYGNSLRHYHFIYLIGGMAPLGGVGPHCMNYIYEFDSISETFTNVYVNIMQKKRSRAPAGIINDMLYVFGGSTACVEKTVDVQICDILDTPDPTIAPSEPTLQPTNDPSLDPTVIPSHSPLQPEPTFPRLQPTNNPSLDPTVIPSHSPLHTPDPTVYPITVPILSSLTRYPSSGPSLTPLKVTHEVTIRETGPEDDINMEKMPIEVIMVLSSIAVVVLLICLVCAIVHLYRSVSKQPVKQMQMTQTGNEMKNERVDKSNDMIEQKEGKDNGNKKHSLLPLTNEGEQKVGIGSAKVNAIDEDEDEDSIDSLYVKKHDCDEATTTGATTLNDRYYGTTPTQMVIPSAATNAIVTGGHVNNKTNGAKGDVNEETGEIDHVTAR
eukprot:636730_1